MAAALDPPVPAADYDALLCVPWALGRRAWVCVWVDSGDKELQCQLLWVDSRMGQRSNSEKDARLALYDRFCHLWSRKCMSGCRVVERRCMACMRVAPMRHATGQDLVSLSVGSL